MYNLAFDTTAASCSIALLDDDKVLVEFNKSMDFGQSELLIPEIKNILEKAQLSFADLGLLNVCTGPGSFTGVRASIAGARAFGIACPNLVIGGVNAFEAYILAFEPQEIADLNIVIIETKRDDFYYQIFDKHLKAITEPAASTFEEIIPQLRHKKVSMIGDGVERFLMKPSGLSLHCLCQKDCLPIALVGQCGFRRYQNKQVDYPKPVYLRAPDVCLKARSAS